MKLPELIQLKLAARRYKDFGDVVFLIRVHNLDEVLLGDLEVLTAALQDDEKHRRLQEGDVG